LAMLLVQFVVPAFGLTDFGKNLYSKVSEQQSQGLLSSLLPSTLSSTLAGTPASPPPPAPVCSPGSKTFDGSSDTDGPDGNVVNFAIGSNNFHASAHYSNRNTPFAPYGTAWLQQNKKWGLGVTNSFEGDGSTDAGKVDNGESGTQTDYVLFEFQ